MSVFFIHILFLLFALSPLNSAGTAAHSKFYVYRNGSYSYSAQTYPSDEGIRSQSEAGDEEWIDVSGGESKEFLEITQDPEFSKLFHMEADLVSDQSGTEVFFNWGDPDYRTDENCFIMSLHPDAHDEIISQFTRSLEMFNGTTEYRIQHSLLGLLACFPDRVLPLTLLQRIPWLKFVERDSIFKGLQIQSDAPWGLSRISSPSLPISGKFGFTYTGKGVDVYVMDSGVNTGHQGRYFSILVPEFGGRASVVKSFYPGSNNDCAGHGTETASVIAGTTVGVAKLATIKSIKVLDCAGNGRNSDLIRGLDFVLQDRGTSVY